MIEYRDHITREMLQAEPEKLFVFGDNIRRTGYGGQARDMRGEPNAVGIPTKKYPSMNENAFLTDDAILLWKQSCSDDLARLLAFDGVIIWPTAGIGTGLAELEARAPRIWRAIKRLELGLSYEPKPCT